MGLTFNQAAQRWQHTSGKKRGRFATGDEVTVGWTVEDCRALDAPQG